MSSSFKDFLNPHNRLDNHIRLFHGNNTYVIERRPSTNEYILFVAGGGMNSITLTKLLHHRKIEGLENILLHLKDILDQEDYINLLKKVTNDWT